MEAQHLKSYCMVCGAIMPCERHRWENDSRVLGPTLTERSLGPHVVSGRLFFKLPKGMSMDCECIGEPYASQIVKLFNDIKTEAYSAGYADAQIEWRWD